MPQRVLMLAYLFPPAGGGGVQRSLGFARHLPEHGWEPVVVSGRTHDYWATDPSLAADLDVEVHRLAPAPWDGIRRGIRRVAPRRARGWLDAAFVPDVRLAWGGAALRRAHELHRERPFAAVYASGPPWTALRVAASFAQSTTVPMVADLRDPWSDNPLRPPTAWTRPLHRRMEAAVHRVARLSIASTEGYRRRLVRHMGLDAARTLHLPNGFTAADFAPELPAAQGEGIHLGYAGSFYPGHGPQVLWQALEAAHRHDPALRLTVHLFGMTGDHRVPGVEVRNHGYVGQREALEGLARCHVVFGTLPFRPGAEACVPQKLYVYLRLGRPVLWCGPAGDATWILGRSSGRWLHVEPGRPSPASLVNWLRSVAGQDGGFDEAMVASYDRGRLTGLLAQALHRLSGDGAGS